MTYYLSAAQEWENQEPWKKVRLGRLLAAISDLNVRKTDSRRNAEALRILL